MDRRRREVGPLGRRAEGAAHEAYRRAIRTGQDLQLSAPSEVLRHGAELLRTRKADAARAACGVVGEAKRRVDDELDRVDQNPVTRAMAIDAAQKAGTLAGVARGGVHAVQGLAQGADFVGRLVNPFDRFTSRPGESAAAQLSYGLVDAGQNAVDYALKARADPGVVVSDVRENLQRWRRDLDPSATPAAPTLKAELRRNFDIAANQGELAAEVGSWVIGGPGAKSVKGLSQASNVGNVSKYLAQGHSPKAAAHLAKPYPLSNRGSHFVPRDTKLPKILGGGPLPRSYMDGLFNKLIPPGISRGDMYERHYKVDPRFHGTSVLREPWSGKKLGLKRYGPAGRIWYGSPAPLKARVGGLGAGAGAAVYHLEAEEEGW